MEELKSNIEHDIWADYNEGTHNKYEQDKINNFQNKIDKLIEEINWINKEINIFNQNSSQSLKDYKGRFLIGS